ncbi:MAG: hypothetical protein V2A79_20450 [Planctomycetota bacterium]
MWCVVLAALVAAGCGTNPWGWPGAPTGLPRLEGDMVRTGDGQEDELLKTVVLDWSGGYSEMASRQMVEPTDLEQLYLPAGETLEIYKETFQEAVRTRVEEILGGIGPARFAVVSGEADDYPEPTVVYFTAEAVSGDRFQVGQTQLDRCDLHAEGTVLVWVGTLLKLGDTHEYDQWVDALANTAAHEIGHTVGFFHPDAEPTDFTEYEKNTEIMMGVHTLSALLSRQEFIIPQETCPEAVAREYGGVAYALPAAATTERPVAACQTNASRERITCDSISE